MFFKDSIEEITYGKMWIQPLLFQDDISRVSTSVRAAQSGNKRIEAVMETKLLDFNLDKSCYIIMGSKKRKEEMEIELKENPLILCAYPMKKVKIKKYLWDIISTAGLSERVQATIEKRKGQVVSSIIETKAVVEDCRSNVVGGILSGLEIWELAILPFLLNNCETWTEISPKTIDLLDNIQCMSTGASWPPPGPVPSPPCCGRQEEP